MSAKGNLFKALQAQLLAKLNFANTLPNLKWVDKNKGQLNNWSNFGAIPLPAILISFPSADWETESQNNQTGTCRVKLVLMYEVYSEFYAESADREEALKCYEYEEQMFAAVQGFSVNGFTALNRTNSNEDEDHDAVVVFTQEYECLLKDTGANTYKNYTLVQPPLKVTRKNPLPMRPPKVVIESGFPT